MNLVLSIKYLLLNAPFHLYVGYELKKYFYLYICCLFMIELLTYSLLRFDL